MSDQFLILAPQVRAAGTDVPPEQIQAALNSIAQQVTIALNSLVGEPEPPSGPAGGDLSGTYPNPTVSKVNGVAAGTMANQNANAVSITGGTISGLSSPLGVTSGGTGQNALSAHNVLIGEGSSGVGFAAPGAAGTILASTGTTTDPSFQSSSSLNLASTTGTLAQFAATTSAQLAGVLTDETGTGSVVFGTSPTIGTATLNTPAVSGGTINNASVGATTPSTGAFTTLSASGTVSGSGFNSYLASPPAIGGTTPASGSFTTVAASSTITPSQTAGIVGTTTNNNANAGSVGEYITATGSGVSLTNNTTANITSISLTAGDWEVSGGCTFAPAATTTVNAIAAGASTTSVTFPSAPLATQIQTTFATGANQTVPIPSQRMSLSVTTTVYLVAQTSFGASTMSATGMIRARRVR